MDLSKLNEQERKMYLDFKGNTNHLKEVLEQNIILYTRNKEFKKLEQTQDFLIKLI